MSRTIDLSKVKFYDQDDQDPFGKHFEAGSLDLVKWIVVNEKNTSTSYVFEIQILLDGALKASETRYRMRIEKFSRSAKDGGVSSVRYAYSGSGLFMLDLYKQCLKPYLNDKLFEFSREVARPLVGSKLFQSVSLTKTPVFSLRLNWQSLNPIFRLFGEPKSKAKPTWTEIRPIWWL